MYLFAPKVESIPWVVRELELWLASKGPSNVVICLTSGDPERPHDLFPNGILKYSLQKQLYIDLRGYRRENDKAYTGRSYSEELLRLAAWLIGPSVRPSDLIEGWRANAAKRAARESCEFRRRVVLIGAALTVVTAGAGFLINKAVHRARGSELVSTAQASGIPVAESLKRALEAYPDAPDLALPVIQAAVGKLAIPV